MEFNFNYEQNAVRTITDDNEQIWFAGIDVCNILEYAHPSQTIEKLDEDERKLDYVKDSSGQSRKTWTINEFGFYSLILTSKKPEAKAFKRWVTHEVLPAIRKAGKYTSTEEQEREEQIQSIIYAKEKLTEERDNLQKKLNTKKKDIDKKNFELIQVLKSDFRQRKIPFDNN
jgi:prophage antirepressor-like protein